MTAQVIKFPRRKPKKRAEDPMEQNLSAIHAIRRTWPFIKSKGKGKGYCYWSVKPTGCWSEDCREGARFARLFLPILRFYGGPSDLCCIVRDMAGDDSGLVCGFMTEIGRVCAVGYQLLDRLRDGDPNGAA